MAQQQPGKAGAGGAPGQVPMPFPLVQNISQLSELSGMPAHVLANPAMALAAQQLVAQRLLQQQMMGGGVRPMMPAQMLALQAQQAQLQQRMAAAAAPAPAAAAKKGAAGGTRKRGRAAAAPAAAPAAAAHGGMAAAAGVDPGGKVVWAKVGSMPWWPAKTLDPQRDPSYPPDADPPRPTSIPIRLFGTFEFQWIGSKRALTDWEEGFAEFSSECDQPSFKAAVAEVQVYKATGKLPDAFYITPEPTHPKAKARGKKRALPRPAEGVELAAATMASAPTAAAAAKAARAAGRAAEPVEDRAVVVQRRKKQRLQELGLLPPDDSPFTSGRVAPNPNLLQHKGEWEQKYATVIEERQQELADIAQRRAEATAAKLQAAQAKAAAEAAAAAAAAPASAASLFAAAQAQQPSAQQLFLMMQQQAALPARQQ